MSETFSNKGISFRVLGFPVTYRWSALGLPVFFAMVLARASGSRLFAIVAVFAVAIGLAVLVHELGHALAARHYGGRASIEIVFTGGLTRHSYPQPPSLGQKAVVSAAGTLSGLAVGTLMALVEPDLLGVVLHPETASGPSGLVGAGVQIFFLATTYWGVFNLLPLPGLDGAHIFDSLTRMVAPARAGVIVPVVTGVVAVSAIVGFFVWQGSFAALWLLFLFGPELSQLGERIRLGRDEQLITAAGEAEQAYWRGDFRATLDKAEAIAGRASSAAVRQAANGLRARALHRLGRHAELLAMDTAPVDARVAAMIAVGRLAEAESLLRHAEPTPARRLRLAEVLIRQDLDARVREVVPPGEAGALVDAAVEAEASEPELARRMAMVALAMPGAQPLDRARAALVAGGEPETVSLDRAERWALEAESAARTGSMVIHPPPDAATGRMVLLRLAAAGRWAQAVEVARMLGDGNGPRCRVAAARSLTAMGRIDQAMVELDRAAAEGFADAPSIAADPVMAPIVADPRWPAIAVSMARSATGKAAIG